MGYANARTIVLDVGFRQYMTTSEMLQDWAVIAGTPTLGIETIESVHPLRYMQFVGVSSTVGATYILASKISEPADMDDLFSDVAGPGFETSLWVQMDAGLAGSQVRVSGGSTRTYSMPSDGSWVSIGHTYNGSGMVGSSTQLSVELINVVGSGTFRIARVLVRRLNNYRPIEYLSRGIVLPFMTDMDTNHKLTLSWLTDILEGWKGGETRAAHREIPRGEFTVDFLADSEEEAALLESLLYGSPGKFFFVPFWADVVRTTASSGSPAVDLNQLDIRSRLFSDNGAVMLWNSPFDYEAVTLKSFAGAEQAWEGLTRSWPTGSLVVPLLPALLPPTAQQTLPIPEFRRLSETFTIPRLS